MQNALILFLSIPGIVIYQNKIGSQGISSDEKDRIGSLFKLYFLGKYLTFQVAKR